MCHETKNRNEQIKLTEKQKHKDDRVVNMNEMLRVDEKERN